WLECDSSTVVDIFLGKVKPHWKLISRWRHCHFLLKSMIYQRVIIVQISWPIMEFILMLIHDDILIFCKGVKIELIGLKKLVCDYTSVFGQQINSIKCKLYTCKVSPRKVESMAALLGFYMGSLPFKLPWCATFHW
ncbi:hypothetical protein Lal_00011331, partial [Lupinus albus]